MNGMVPSLLLVAVGRAYTYSKLIHGIAIKITLAAVSLTSLEDQMCEWVPGAEKSPDRVDALVWALSQLILIGVQSQQPYETYLGMSFSSWGTRI